MSQSRALRPTLLSITAIPRNGTVSLLTDSTSGRRLTCILTSVHAREEIGSKAEGLDFVSKAEPTKAIAEHILRLIEARAG